MKDIRLLLCLLCATVVYAQQPQPTAAVPKLVRFSGYFRPANGLAAQPVESVTLAVYRDQTGGNALWQEIQNVTVDTDGHYSLLMGVTQNEGMPLDLFSSGEPRWLGARFNRPGETEQPRVLLVSVPYALKASDADTLGGRPASAYLLAGAPVGTSTGLATSTTATTPAKSTKATSSANSGFPNFIGKFVDTTNLVDSPIYDANGLIGISTTQPSIALDVRTGSLPQMGIAGNTDYLTFFASDIYGPAIYWDPAKDMRFGKGGAGLYNPYGFVEQMRIQSSTGNLGIGTMSPASKLDVAGDINLSGSVLYQGSPMLQVPGGLGAGNIALGQEALVSNTNGCCNTAIGAGALQKFTTGSSNTAIGYLAGNNNGYYNIAIGYQAGYFSYGNSQIHIGSPGQIGDTDGTIRIGDGYSSFFAGGIRGITTGYNDAIPVMIDSAGQLGTVSSSWRYKEDIQEMGAASHDLMRLRPVTFRYKQPFADGSKPIQYGLIAEEVAEVYPDLVAHSADGQVETVKYQVLDSMLLNEVQRQQVEIGRLEQRINGEHQQNENLRERLARLETALTSMSRLYGISGVR